MNAEDPCNKEAADTSGTKSTNGKKRPIDEISLLNALSREHLDALAAMAKAGKDME